MRGEMLTALDGRAPYRRLDHGFCLLLAEAFAHFGKDRGDNSGLDTPPLQNSDSLSSGEPDGLISGASRWLAKIGSMFGAVSG